MFQLRERDDSLYASFKTNKQSFIYWALQYGEYIEVIEPKEVKRRNLKTNFIKKFIRKI